MTIVYRLHSGRYPANSGKGAAKHGGRWNRPGTEAIYTSQSVSLAALEILAHYSILPRDFVLTTIRIPDRISVFTPLIGLFPKDWNLPAPNNIITEAQRLGSEWLNYKAVLAVPSAIIPHEFNFILSPAHADFQYIEFRASQPFRFDPRL